MRRATKKFVKIIIVCIVSCFIFSLSPFTFHLVPPSAGLKLAPFTAAHAAALAPTQNPDEPFTGPANWGGTGLMEIPTARVMNEGKVRFGASQVNPYRYYYVALSPFKGFEFDGRVTESIGVPSGLGSAYGNDKDKSMDLKYQFFKEGKYMPALALGIFDPQGTGHFRSQLIVASKQIYPFDFTLGFGNGRYGKQPLGGSGDFQLEIFSDTKQWLKDSQFFWGIQFAPSEKFALMMEYNPIKYETLNVVGEIPVDSRFNYGIRLKPFKWTDIDFTYQRGNQFGVNFSMAFDIGNPIIPIYDKPYVEKPQKKTDPISDRITEALHESGFSNIGVKLAGNELWIEAQNGKYFYNTRALGVMLKILYDLKPVRVDKINIVLHENGIPLIQLNTTLVDIYELYNDKISLREFLRLSDVKALNVGEYPDIKTKYNKIFDYGLKPDFKTFLNDPSGFFKYRLGAAGWVSFNPWPGGSFIAELNAYAINTVSTNQGPLSRPVRSDIVPYLQQNFVLDKLMYQQILKFDKGYYGRFAGGILEMQYAGIDGELAKSIVDGRFYVGLSSSVVRKRAVDEFFQLKSDDWKEYYNTCFLNTRLNIPEIEMIVEANAGHFLAGDNGVRITVSKFIKGVTLFAWYSFTDTSIFTDSFNKGYNDKGIGITIPLRLFEGTDSRTAYSYSISPWTRDVAQDIDHSTTLFDFFGRNSKIYVDKDKGYIYK